MLRHRTKLVSFPGFQGAKFVCIRQVFIIYPLEDNLDFNLEALPKTIMLNDGSLERFLGRFNKDAAMEIVSTTALTEDLLANFKVLQKGKKDNIFYTLEIPISNGDDPTTTTISDPISQRFWMTKDTFLAKTLRFSMEMEQRSLFKPKRFNSCFVPI
jgi:hypothetical protein